MKKFVTILEVVSRGDTDMEAAENVGKVLDASMMEPGTTVSCGPVDFLGYEKEDQYKRCSKNRPKFRTTVTVVNNAEDVHEAAYKANGLFDIKKMQDPSSIMWISTEPKTPGRFSAREVLASCLLDEKEPVGV